MLALLFGTLIAVQPLAERRVMLTGFDRVRVDGPFSVTIATGGGAGARVMGGAAAVETVQLRVEGNVLILTPARDDRGRPLAGPAPAIALTTGRVGAVTSRGGGQVQATLVGAGRLTLAGRAARARVMVNGPGEVEADALLLDELIVQGNGPGGGRYRVRYAADITASGSGTVRVAGTARCRTRGTATIRCGT